MNYSENQLLSDYKKYDYLNSDDKNPIIKILVSYIKPSFLYKSKILTPIQLGRSVEKDISKDGEISNKDLDWLHANCINDDFDGGISQYNRRIGFFTGTYLAWKNYEKLGNPQYFGSFGYRKLLEANALEDLSSYDMILPKKDIFKPSLKFQFIQYHGIESFKAAELAIKTIYPNEWEEVNNYFSNPEGYFYEIYILKKELFFNYCNWIYPLIEFWLKMDFTDSKLEGFEKYLYQKSNEKRDIAFIIERITGYYFYKLTKLNVKYKEIDVIKYDTKKDIQRLFHAMRQNALDKLKN